MYTWDILVAHMLSVILHFGTKNVFVLFKMLVIKPRGLLHSRQMFCYWAKNYGGWAILTEHLLKPRQLVLSHSGINIPLLGCRKVGKELTFWTCDLQIPSLWVKSQLENLLIIFRLPLSHRTPSQVTMLFWGFEKTTPHPCQLSSDRVDWLLLPCLCWHWCRCKRKTHF